VVREEVVREKVQAREVEEADAAADASCTSFNPAC
jgi:hypothetical protein